MPTQEAWMQLQELYRQGMSQSQIKRALCLGRETVRKYLKQPRRPYLPRQRRVRKTDLFAAYLRAARVGLSTFVRCLGVHLQASLNLGQDCWCKNWQALFLVLGWLLPSHDSTRHADFFKRGQSQVEREITWR